MRCQACNKVLSDYEATRRAASTNEFIDLCNGCYRHIKDDVPTVGREDLHTDSDDLPQNSDRYERDAHHDTKLFEEESDE